MKLQSNNQTQTANAPQLPVDNDAAELRRARMDEARAAAQKVTPLPSTDTYSNQAPAKVEIAPQLPAVPDAQPTPTTDGASLLSKLHTDIFSGVVVKSYGASSVAVDAARDVVTRMLQRDDVRDQMRRNHVELAIIPPDAKLTELPGFEKLKGQGTFDGRPWEEVRGVGNVVTEPGVQSLAVGEENLAHLKNDKYAKHYSLATHEFAHMIHANLPLSEQKAIHDAYEARKAASGPWTDHYASENEHEYFAQATGAFFGVNDGEGQNSATWIQQNDPALFEILRKVYPLTATPPVS